MRATPCPNLNHRHTKAPVRFCPLCGDVVNDRVPFKRGCRDEHDQRRRQQQTFCIDCGEQLRH